MDFVGELDERVNVFEVAEMATGVDDPNGIQIDTGNLTVADCDGSGCGDSFAQSELTEVSARELFGVELEEDVVFRVCGECLLFIRGASGREFEITAIEDAAEAVSVED